jgi:hypothetical protein
VTRSRAAAAGLLLALAAAAPAGGAVKAPPSGSRYEGFPGGIVLVTSGRSIQLAAFSFRCDSTRGRTSLNDVRLRRTRRGYRFEIRTFGSVSFEDGRPDENAQVRFRGRFSRSAKSVRGAFRVTSASCRSGIVEWTALR